MADNAGYDLESLTLYELQELRIRLKLELTKVETKIESKFEKRQHDKKSIIKLIQNAAEMYGWKRIKCNSQNQNAFSHLQCKQRINIWLKKSEKITIRIQPLEMIFKDVEPKILDATLQNVNASIINEGKS